MRLFGFGQPIASDMPVAGAVPWSRADPPGIVVRRHPPAPVAPGAVYTRLDDGLIFAAPHTATYRCRADAVDVTPYPAADPGDVAALLIATALPAVLWLQGRYVLHAAVVCLPGCAAAVAIAGPSGIGKSTVAAALLARGAGLVADDSVALNDAAVASGLPGGVFEGTAGTQRRFLAVAPERAIVSAPLAALFVLARGDGPRTRLAPVAAVTALLRERHRPRIPVLLGRQHAALATSALLGAAIPVYAWPRRDGAIPLAETEWQMLLAASQQERDT